MCVHICERDQGPLWEGALSGGKVGNGKVWGGFRKRKGTGGRGGKAMGTEEGCRGGVNMNKS